MEKEKKSLREQIGEYLVDISKLTFGGLVLSLILEVSVNKVLVLISGTCSTFAITLLGFYLLNKKR